MGPVRRRALLRFGALIAVAVLGWGLVRSRGGAAPAGSPPALPVAVPEAARSGSPDGRIPNPERGFRDPELLTEHFRKHGAEFGEITKTEYLRLAQTLRDRAAVGPVREAVRRDGVVTRFDRQSGAFLAFDPDGTIRTFFRPNDGERYFDRQLRRGRSER
jgi:hypothetical protein